MPWNETQGEQASIHILPVQLVKDVHLHAHSRTRQQTSCIQVTRTRAVFEKHKLLNLGALSPVQQRSAKEIRKLQNPGVLSITADVFVCSLALQDLFILSLLGAICTDYRFFNCLTLCCSPLPCNPFVTLQWNLWCQVWHKKQTQMRFWGNMNCVGSF